MKKAIIAIAAIASTVTSAGAAGTVDNPIQSTEWTSTANTATGLTTYATTIDGAFDIDMGIATIKDGESFTLTVITKSSGWGNSWGTGVISTTDALSGANGKDQFTLYVGSTTNKKTELKMNTWQYSLGDLNYDEVPANPSMPDNPLTLSFVIDWNAETKLLTFSNGVDSDVTGTSHVQKDIVTTFNFSHLTNIGQPMEGNNPVGSPLVAPDVVTTIMVTKATPADATGGNIPEPTTATLSLLALAGLCARRRRK